MNPDSVSVECTRRMIQREDVLRFVLDSIILEAYQA